MRNSSPTKMTRAWHECNTSETKRHECNSSAHKCYTNDMSPTRTTRVRHERKILILITTRGKTYFHTPALAIWQMKDYKERDNFILRTTFWKCLATMPKCL